MAGGPAVLPAWQVGLHGARSNREGGAELRSDRRTDPGPPTEVFGNWARSRWELAGLACAPPCCGARAREAPRLRTEPGLIDPTGPDPAAIRPTLPMAMQLMARPP
jgi:hypothetical protein